LYISGQQSRKLLEKDRRSKICFFASAIAATVEAPPPAAPGRVSWATGTAREPARAKAEAGPRLRFLHHFTTQSGCRPLPQEERPMIPARAKPSALRWPALSWLAPAALLVLGHSNALAGEDLIVKYDQSQLLRLPRPAAEIIIGNPAIADIAIQSGNLLVVTGKSFGITNIIALDAERNVIQDQRVLVRRDDAKVVNLQRGTERQTFNCTPQCNPSIVIGDDQKYFDMISKAAQAKIGFSERAADSGAPAASQ
jgi:hypothetical protein